MSERFWMWLLEKTEGYLGVSVTLALPPFPPWDWMLQPRRSLGISGKQMCPTLSCRENGKQVGPTEDDGVTISELSVLKILILGEKQYSPKYFRTTLLCGFTTNF